MRKTFVLVAIVLAPLQSASAQRAPRTTPRPPEEQITQAVLPLPADMRGTASVLGYSPEGKLTMLRSGAGSMICLATDPASARFHVACYHKSLEPFMARGRELRAQGVKGDMVDSARFREAREGKLKLPDAPALLYSLTGAKDAYDPATKTAKARALFVVYMPYATSETTGLSAVPAEGTPWVMFPGTPKAHIMFVPKM
jgi:hypothetical protein